jgi:hypothetical protein
MYVLRVVLFLLLADGRGGHAATAVGSARQLFLDARLLQSQGTATIAMHALEIDDAQHSPVITPGGPGGGEWEGRIAAYNSIVQVGEKVLLFYDAITSAAVQNDIQRSTCVAISTDSGRTFHKPILGLVSFNGSTSNNIVFPPNATAHSPGTVFLDKNPATPADERFKMIAKWFPDANRTEPNKVRRDGTWTFASPDGLRWRPLSRRPVYLMSDTQDVALWDPSRAKYVAFRRLHQGQQRVCQSCAGGALQPPLAAGQWREAGCIYQRDNATANKGCPLPAQPLQCSTDADCGVKHQLGNATGVSLVAPACFGKPLQCLDGFCGAYGEQRCNPPTQPPSDCPSKQPSLYCIADPDSGPSGYCGQGMNALRFVGRCESPTLTHIDKCDEGVDGDPLQPLPKNESQIVTVFGPDAHDNACSDTYTNQVIMYEGQYIAFPAAYTHYPSPPVWPHANDGVWTTRIMHSHDGASGWHYISGDRRAFLARGPAGSWRASMVAVVRGLVVSEATLRLFVWGSECRHGQTCGDRDGAILPVEIRRDGFASLRSAPDGSASLATTVPLVFTGSRLLVNVKTSGGGALRVGLTPVGPTTDALQSGLAMSDCILVSGNYPAGIAVGWTGRGQNVSGVKMTQITSFNFQSIHVCFTDTT